MIRRLIIIIGLTLLPGMVVAQTDTRIEFYGTIQSANDTALVVNGQIVDIRSATVNTPLTAGMGVRVQALVQPDGSLLAWQVDGLPAGVVPGIVEINGTVTSIAFPLVTITNQIIDITGAEISGTLNIGQPVRVFAAATAPGLWQARFVDAADMIVPPPVATEDPLPPATPVVVPPPAETPDIIFDDDDKGRDRSDDSENRGRGNAEDRNDNSDDDD